MLRLLEDVCLAHSHSIEKYGNETGVYVWVTSEPTFFKGWASEDRRKWTLYAILEECVFVDLTLVYISSLWDLNHLEKSTEVVLMSFCIFIAVHLVLLFKCSDLTNCYPIQKLQ